MSTVGVLHIDTPPWMAQAACTHVNPDWFHPDRGKSPRSAKLVCLGCPVRMQCAAYALSNNEPEGVWGFLTSDERRAIRRGRPGPKLELRCGKGHNLVGNAIITDRGVVCLRCRNATQRRYETARQRRRRRPGGAA